MQPPHHYQGIQRVPVPRLPVSDLPEQPAATVAPHENAVASSHKDRSKESTEQEASCIGGI